MSKRNFRPFIIPFLLLALVLGCSKNDSNSKLPGNSENYKSVGASAHDLLSNGTGYSSVKIEVQYMPGFGPDAGAINNLVAFLNMLINKPNGITVVQTQIPSSGKTILSLADIVNIEKANRTVYTAGSQIGVYFLYTDGNYTEANVLGVAYRNTSLCMFGKTVHDN